MTVNNDGTASCSVLEGIAFQNGAGIDNQPAGSFTFLTNAYFSTDGTATFFQNDGRLTVAEPSGGFAEIAPAFTQTATGSITLQSGGFETVGNVSISGPITAAAGTIFNSQGPITSFDGSSTLTSAGTVQLESLTTTEDGAYDVSGSTQVLYGTAAFNAPITNLGTDLKVDRFATFDVVTNQSFTLTSLEVNQGTLHGAGSGNLTVTASMTWNGGTISGFAALNITNQATLSLGAGSGIFPDDTLDGVTVNNDGTASCSVLEGIAFQNGAGIDNQPAGSFTFLTNAYFSTDGTATFFQNDGRLTVAEPSGGFAEIAPAFTQTATGSITLQSGGFETVGNVSISGPITAAAGTIFNSQGPITSFDGSSTLTSAGTVQLESLTTTEDGAYDVSGSTQVLYGTAAFNAPITNLGTDLKVDRFATFDVVTNQSFTLTSLEVNQGTLHGAGSGNLTVTASMTWNGGTISGFAALNITNQATLSLAPAPASSPTIHLTA